MHVCVALHFVCIRWIRLTTTRSRSSRPILSRNWTVQTLSGRSWSNAITATRYCLERCERSSPVAFFRDCELNARSWSLDRRRAYPNTLDDRALGGCYVVCICMLMAFRVFTVLALCLIVTSYWCAWYNFIVYETDRLATSARTFSNADGPWHCI